MKIHKRPLIAVLIAIIMAFVLAGCTEQTPSNPTDISNTTDYAATDKSDVSEIPETSDLSEKSEIPETSGPSEQSAKPKTTEVPEPDTKVDRENKDKERKYASDIDPMEKKQEKNDVIFSAEGGVYADAFELDLTCEAGSTIYYTVDGSDPAESKTAIKYETSIEIKDRKGDVNVLAAVDTSLFCTNYGRLVNGVHSCTMKTPADEDVDKCTVIRAVAKSSDGTCGRTLTNTYFIGKSEDHIQGIKESCEAAGQPLAVISITTDFDNLYDEAKGIYVKGKVFDVAYSAFLAKNPNSSADDARKVDANYSQRGKAWEREIHVEMFEMDENGATQVISTDCGMRVQGNYSRSDLQKGLRLYARSSYGDKKFKYAVFGKEATDSEGKKIKKYDTLVLRAGGNTTFQAKYNDTYWQDTVSNLDLATKASRPCVVYINGEYFGLYVLEEDYSQDFFEAHYGVNADDVIIYKGDAEEYESGYKLDEGDVPDGESEDYYLRELIDFFNKHDNLKPQADFDEFAKLVDVESLRDYFVSEAWINNKWDWPGKNWVIWKSAVTDTSNEYADGRWRLAMLDLDFGGVSGRGEASANTIKEANYKNLGLLDKNTNNPVVLMFAYSMTNEGFVKEFEEALLESNNTTFEKERLLALLKEYEGSYGPLFEQFFRRYPGTGSANDALNGGYASSKCIKEFIQFRATNIQKMTDWIEKNKQ